jgi:hypothetical protein
MRKQKRRGFDSLVRKFMAATIVKSSTIAQMKKLSLIMISFAMARHNTGSHSNTPKTRMRVEITNYEKRYH